MKSQYWRCTWHCLTCIITSLVLFTVLGSFPGSLEAGTGAATLAGGDKPGGLSSPELPGNKEMFDSLTRTVQQLEQASAGLPQLAQIGTFNHWALWMGWEGSFSDTYLPNSEAYDWVVHFAPEGVYLSLQSSKSVYSGVDVFYGIGSFIGMVVSPDGDVITRDYLGSLQGSSITFNLNPFAVAGVGPLSQMGFAAGIGPTFFQKGDSNAFERGIQYNQSLSVSFSLIPFNVPVSVSMNYESTFNNGFYPIISWNLDPTVSNPFNAILTGLQSLSASQWKTVAQKIAREMALKLLPFIRKLQTSGPVTLQNNEKGVSEARYFGQFLQDNSLTVPADSPNTSIDYIIKRAEFWKNGGWDPASIFQEINFPFDSNQLAKDLKVVKPATELAFEVGYQLVYDMNPNDVSANCINHIQATPGQPVDIVVTATEIAALLPGTSPEDFEGVEVWFTNPPEAYLYSQGISTSVTLEDGQAVYEFTQASDTSFVIAVQIYSCAATQNKKLILCRRILDFTPNTSSSPSPVIELLLAD